MKKLINAAESVCDEMLSGLTMIYPRLRQIEGQKVLVRADIDAIREDRVAIISGGGSGHEPAHAGYIGKGMLSAAVAGDVFTSPPPDAVLAAIRAVTGPAGCLLIVKNYTGDRLNFGLAAERARSEGLSVEVVIVADDVALAEKTEHAGRRGLAGTILVHKIAGAAAESGLSLAEVTAEARAASASVRTMGVALGSCTVPAAGKPGFVLSETEIELGLGIHGEPGFARVPLQGADSLVDALLTKILPEVDPGSPLVLVVNGLGGTPAMELAIVARRAVLLLEAHGRVVERAYVGNFLTALEMAGVSLSLLAVNARQLDRLDAPTLAPAWPAVPGRPSNRLKEPLASLLVPIHDAMALSPPTTQIGNAIESAIKHAAESLIKAEPELTASDQMVGDGDLGISLARGARAILERLPTMPVDDPAATGHILGACLEHALGGTSGPLYAAFFVRSATSLAEKPNDWAAAFQAGCDAVHDLGGASPGDRTMLDALAPASQAFSQAIRAGSTHDIALKQAAIAAKRGAAGTASMLPRRGRSSYLGKRAVGHPDPGAQAVTVWLEAIAT